MREKENQMEMEEMKDAEEITAHDLKDMTWFHFWKAFEEVFWEFEGDPDLQNAITKMLLKYAFHKEEPTKEDGPYINALFKAWKHNIDRTHKQYVKSKKGGAPEGNRNARKQPKINQETTQREKEKKDKKENQKKDDKEEKKKNKTEEREGEKESPGGDLDSLSPLELLNYFINDYENKIESFHNEFIEEEKRIEELLRECDEEHKKACAELKKAEAEYEEGGYNSETIEQAKRKKLISFEQYRNWIDKRYKDLSKCYDKRAELFEKINDLKREKELLNSQLETKEREKYDYEEFVAYSQLVRDRFPEISKNLKPLSFYQYIEIYKSIGWKEIEKLLHQLNNKPGKIAQYTELYGTLLSWIEVDKRSQRTTRQQY